MSAGAAAAAAASSDGSGVASSVGSDAVTRRPLPGGGCLCSIAEGAHAVEIDTTPVQSIADANERIVLSNIARILLTLKMSSSVSASEWWVEDDTDAERYIVHARYAAGTIFSLNELNLVQQVNEVLVDDVFVIPPTDKDNLTVVIAAGVRKASHVLEFTTASLCVIHQRTTTTGRLGKRRRQ